jgi:receptor protein-tyrosine kinase
MADAPAEAASMFMGASATIGQLLVEHGALSAGQAEQVAQRQQALGASFGEAAVAMGLVRQEMVDRAVARQFDFAMLPDGDQRFDPSLALSKGAADIASEQIRSLRTRLWLELTTRFGERAPEFALFGLGMRQDRAVISANLAIAFAQAGLRTLLIDADLRTPSLHRLFRAANQSGLSTFLAGRTTPAIVAIEEIRHLAVLTSGPIPPNPGELLSGLSGRITELRNAWQADLVIVDAPDLDSSDDAYLVAEAMSAGVIVAKRNAASARKLIDAARQFEGVGCRLVGSVLDAG